MLHGDQSSDEWQLTCCMDEWALAELETGMAFILKIRAKWEWVNGLTGVGKWEK